MKNSIIFLLGLVLLFSIPTLASTPENENAPAMTSEDQQFMGLTQLSEEELMKISGNIILDQTTGEPPTNTIVIYDYETHEYIEVTQTYNSNTGEWTPDYGPSDNW
jgi:hypothetical protein